MDTLRSMALFVKVAETGSFKQAAEEMNYSNSLISKEIGKLEQMVGARLLQRSTRKIHLTEIGLGYLERCRKILSADQEAHDYVQEMQGQPKGRLKINAPMTLGITDLSLAFAAFTELHPEVELDVDLSDEPVDLIAQGYDIGFRVSSTFIDVNYVGKPIASFSLHLVTTPKYLQNHGPIECPEQLSEHNFYLYSLANSKNKLPIGGGITVKGNLKANNTIFLRDALLQGNAIGLFPSFVCAKEIKSGLLVELLVDYPLPKLNFYVLYPSRHYTPPKLAKFVEFMQAWFENKDIS
ncbi:LysR family transcriptional regulator [Psychromonas sp. CNPT3]|uniref:LysR family transcriptional regulator n=1 Tax=Psychromonas sp. CNPT3 TaxID=314282 RepID=UPI00006E9A57|nr:LysR family transcriptional regulator [Psychromonas sp. CNPT3]AGH82251.1 LysR family transcriptional regulator [Psychromonas sp. CNPT3]